MIRRRDVLLALGTLALPTVLLAPSIVAAKPPDGQQAILARLVGTTWRAVSILGQPVRPVTGTDFLGRPVTVTVASTLTFVSTVAIAGGAGCNRYGGPVRVDGGRLRIGPIVTTLIACAPARVMTQEKRFLAALLQGERLALRGFFLLLYSTGQPAPTRFVRVGRVEPG
ncbi:META domain-containing protein [Benzoatithermus flavus]|uniref:META domain-containing protein n=1 Tax=Benzoatithermus flavus TaxID=3108223 RepID=A0ABU8XM28_9PROT